MPCNKNLTLKQWAYSCMSPEKAKSFLDYFDGRIYRIGKDRMPYLVKDDDLIPESHFKAYCNDFEWWINYVNFEFGKAVMFVWPLFIIDFFIRNII